MTLEERIELAFLVSLAFGFAVGCLSYLGYLK